MRFFYIHKNTSRVNRYGYYIRIRRPSYGFNFAFNNSKQNLSYANKIVHYLLHLHCPPLIFLQRLVVASICCSRSCLFTLLLVSFVVLSALLGGDHRHMLTWKSCVEIEDTAARCALIWWQASQCWWGLLHNSICGASQHWKPNLGVCTYVLSCLP
jgi:hypothetical protein